MRLHSDACTDFFTLIDIVHKLDLVVNYHIGVVIIVKELNFICEFEIFKTLIGVIESLFYICRVCLVVSIHSLPT